MKPTVQQVILQYLSRGEWCAPFEVRKHITVSGLGFDDMEAVTARIRDLRKVRYGGHTVKKQRRAGTTYYEYRIFDRVERQDQKAA